MDLQTAEKHQLVQTTNSAGFDVVVKIAEALVKEFDTKAMECEDESRSLSLLREAHIARKFWGQLINRIDQHKFVHAAPAVEFVSTEAY